MGNSRPIAHTCARKEIDAVVAQAEVRGEGDGEGGVATLPKPCRKHEGVNESDNEEG